MNARQWIDHFARNRNAFEEPDWSAEYVSSGPLAEDARLPLLIQSLATFQLGESGGGSRLLRFVERETGADSDYCTAMQMFVEEEQYHAELLARVVRYLGGELLQRHWMNSVFRGARSLVNLEFNVQVLLTAELIAEAYYGSLYRHVDDPIVRGVAGKILADEVRHIAFHRDFFRTRHRRRLPYAGALWSLQFQGIFLATERAVWSDHGKCLRAFAVSADHFRAEARGCCRRFLEAVLAPASHRRGSIARLPDDAERA